MKAILISLLVGLVAGGGVFFALGFMSGKKQSAGGGGGARSARRKRNDDNGETKVPGGSTGKQVKVVPQSEWKRGRFGGGLS